MMQIRTRGLRLTLKTLLCPCGGEMEATMHSSTKNGVTTWPHKCDACGLHIKITDRYYPYKHYEYVAAPGKVTPFEDEPDWGETIS